VQESYLDIGFADHDAISDRFDNLSLLFMGKRAPSGG